MAAYYNIFVIKTELNNTFISKLYYTQNRDTAFSNRDKSVSKYTNN